MPRGFRSTAHPTPAKRPFAVLCGSGVECAGFELFPDPLLWPTCRCALASNVPAHPSGAPSLSASSRAAMPTLATKDHVNGGRKPGN
jgi:hypothetical protein